MSREVECYGLHIKQSDFDKVMWNDKVTDILKKYDGAVTAMSKDPIKYCGSLVFKSEKARNEAITALKNIGIDAVMEIAPAYVDVNFVRPSWLKEE